MSKEVIFEFIEQVIPYIRHFLYQNDEDDCFGYYTSLPDWSTYLAFLKERGQLKNGISIGGMWLEKCYRNSDWGLVSKSWGLEIRLFLFRLLDETMARFYLQNDLIEILRILEVEGIVLKSELEFEKGGLSEMMRRSGLALTSGELKLSLMVNEE